MIEIESLSKTYGEARVVVDVTMAVPANSITVIVGTSGSGKTTVLRMVNRLVEPTSGTVRIDGQDTGAVPGPELRRQIGYVIQGHGLFPHRTVGAEHRYRPEPARLGAGADRCAGRRAADALPARPRALRTALSARTLGRPAAARRRGAGAGG